MQNHHRLPHGTFDGMDKEEEVLVLPMKSHKFVWLAAADWYIMESEERLYYIV